jgi:hypothetical protein
MSPLLLAVPVWVWATLLTVAFVLVSVATMWLIRYPVENVPPPLNKRNDSDSEG